jgi:hypothetical protein
VAHTVSLTLAICLSDLFSHVCISYLYNNPFEHISKTAFDVLPQSVTM